MVKGDGFSGPYLTAFLYHNEMPMTRDRVTELNGYRLWRELSILKLAHDHYEDTTVHTKGILQMVLASNHGFRAPIEMQERLLELVAIRPDGAHTLEQLRTHYMYCRSFRAAVAELSSSPSHLDFFKDERVEKKWRDWAGPPQVLLNLNSLLRAWPLLMPAGWNPANASRDMIALVESARADIEELHRNIETEGAMCAANSRVHHNSIHSLYAVIAHRFR